MNYFRFSYKQSEKGLGRAFLFSMVLGFIFALSILIVMVKVLNAFNNTDLKEIADETGCQIVNYELTCNDSYYKYDSVIVDLDNTNYETAPDEILLTKDRFVADNQIFTYKDMLDSFGYGPNFNVNDLQEAVQGLAVVLIVFGFIGVFIFGSIYFIVANMILAGVMLLIINAVLKINMKYDQMFKLTFFAVLPYVAFNALTRMIIDQSLVGYITSFIPVPFIPGFLHIVIDYVIIYFIIYYIVKKQYRNPEKVEEQKESQIELPFDVE